ncbi:X-ray repair cross-complementing protein 6 [Branchiostoma belcheri]|nr:X-ray repair cross-complementing protein 6 [Branchiostoma belcheri]
MEPIASTGPARNPNPMYTPNATNPSPTHSRNDVNPNPMYLQSSPGPTFKSNKSADNPCTQTSADTHQHAFSRQLTTKKTRSPHSTVMAASLTLLDTNKMTIVAGLRLKTDIHPVSHLKMRSFNHTPVAYMCQGDLERNTTSEALSSQNQNQPAAASNNDVLHALDPNPMYAAADMCQGDVGWNTASEDTQGSMSSQNLPAAASNSINDANDVQHALYPNPMYVPNVQHPAAHESLWRPPSPGIKEAIYIRALQPSLNRDGGRHRLSATYDPLLTESRPRWSSLRDSLIFLIDCSASMFQEEEGEEGSAFHKCVKCVHSAMRNKIISNDRDLVGVVFFATNKHKNQSDFKHVYIFQDLEVPGAQMILELEEIFEEDGVERFEEEFGHGTDFSMSEVLWNCSNMFSTCTQKLGHKRLLLFTNNDDPHAGNINLQRQAKTKAKDLEGLGINTELLHMNKPGGEPFDITKFYQDIIVITEDEDVTCLPDPAAKFEELLERHGSLQGAQEEDISTCPTQSGGSYTQVRETYKGKKVKLDARTNQEVRTITKTVDSETGKFLMPSDVKKVQSWGGRDIAFENDEIVEMKVFDKPGLVLMGFKPRTSLKPYFHIRPAQFLFPDESVISGSTRLFSALLQRCLARDVVPICRYIPRKNSPPKFVALLPQKEEFDDNNMQSTPAGFHVIFLPFADDLRKLNFEDTPRAKQDQVDKAKEIINKLKFKYDPMSFENPVIQQHYRNLEALALDRDAPEEVYDFTPKREM